MRDLLRRHPGVMTGASTRTASKSSDSLMRGRLATNSGMLKLASGSSLRGNRTAGEARPFASIRVRYRRAYIPSSRLLANTSQRPLEDQLCHESAAKSTFDSSRRGDPLISAGSRKISLEDFIRMPPSDWQKDNHLPSGENRGK